MRRRAVKEGALMSEIGAAICIGDDGASVRHPRRSLSRSVRIKQSTEISPKGAEEEDAAMESEARQLRFEQPEQSAAARYQALIRISAAVTAQRDAEGLFPLLATELRQVVSFNLMGISQYDEATNKTHWQSIMTGGNDRGITD